MKHFFLSLYENLKDLEEPNIFVKDEQSRRLTLSESKAYYNGRVIKAVCNCRQTGQQISRTKQKKSFRFILTHIWALDSLTKLV